MFSASLAILSALCIAGLSHVQAATPANVTNDNLASKCAAFKAKVGNVTQVSSTHFAAGATVNITDVNGIATNKLPAFCRECHFCGPLLFTDTKTWRSKASSCSSSQIHLRTSSQILKSGFQTIGMADFSASETEVSHSHADSSGHRHCEIIFSFIPSSQALLAQFRTLLG